MEVTLKVRQKINFITTSYRQICFYRNRQDFKSAKIHYDELHNLYLEIKKDLLNDTSGQGFEKDVADHIKYLAKHFSKPIQGEGYEWEYKIFSKILNDTIMVVKETMINRGTYRQNINGLPTYTDTEALMIKSASDEDKIAVHKIKKCFEGIIVKVSGQNNPDISVQLSEFPSVSRDIKRINVIKL